MPDLLDSCESHQCRLQLIRVNSHHRKARPQSLVLQWSSAHRKHPTRGILTRTSRHSRKACVQSPLRVLLHRWAGYGDMARHCRDPSARLTVAREPEKETSWLPFPSALHRVTLSDTPAEPRRSLRQLATACNSLQLPTGSLTI